MDVYIDLIKLGIFCRILVSGLVIDEAIFKFGFRWVSEI